MDKNQILKIDTPKKTNYLWARYGIAFLFGGVFYITLPATILPLLTWRKYIHETKTPGFKGTLMDLRDDLKEVIGIPVEVVRLLVPENNARKKEREDLDNLESVDINKMLPAPFDDPVVLGRNSEISLPFETAMLIQSLTNLPEGGGPIQFPNSAKLILQPNREIVAECQRCGLTKELSIELNNMGVLNSVLFLLNPNRTPPFTEVQQMKMVDGFLKHCAEEVRGLPPSLNQAFIMILNESKALSQMARDTLITECYFRKLGDEPDSRSKVTLV